MDPVTLSLLTSLGGTAISGLLGRGKDKAAEKRRREIMRLSSPEHMGNLTNQFYSQFMSSPAYSQAQRGVAMGGQKMGNQLNASLAARGLNTSGIGAIAPALAGSATAGQLGQLRTGGYAGAQQQASGIINRQIGAQEMAPTNYAGDAVGAGLGDLASLLLGAPAKAKKKRQAVSSFTVN